MAGTYNLGTAEGTIRINYDGKGVTQANQGINQVEQSGKKAGTSLNDAGNKMAIAGGVIAAGIGYATTKAIDFEKQISAIGAVSDASNKQMDQLRQKALQLGADTQFSASEAAGAMEELAKAGVSVPDILNGAADAATALAAAGGVDLPTAATLAANAMNAFNLKATDLKGVVDLIAGAANASAIDVGQFGESLQQVGAVAHLSGLDFHDTAVAIAELGNAGIKGSDAGTSLKTFLQSLIPQTKQQKELFDQLGITTNGLGNKFFDASGKAKSLADISQVLQNATRGMSEEQKLATLQILFGSDAIRAAAVFADNGADGFNKLSDAMGKTSAADVAAKRMNNAAGQLEQMKGSVETAGIAFGELLLPGITRTAKVLTQFANYLNGLDPTTKKIILDIAGIVSGLLLFSAGLIKVVQFARAFNDMAKAIKLYTLVSKIAAAVTKAWTAAQLALDGAMSASVIGLIVLAIVALAAAVYLVIKYHQQIGAFFVKVWHGILDVVSLVWNWIKDHWPLLVGILLGPFGIVVALIATHLKQIQGFFSAVFGAIGGFFAKVGGAIGSFFAGIGKAIAGFFVAAFSPFINLVAPAFIAIWGFIEAVFKLGISIVTALWAVFWTLLSAAIKVFVDAAITTWNIFWTALKTVFLAFWNFVQPYIQAALNQIMASINFWVNLAKTVWNAVFAFMRLVIQAFVGFIQAALNTLSIVWNAVWNAMSAAAQAVWSVIGPVIMGFVNGIVAGVRGGLNVLQAIWNVAWNVIKTVVIGVSQAITAVIRAFVAVIAGIFNGLTAIVNSFRRFFDQLHAAANGGTGTLIAFLAQIPKRILGALGNLGSLLFNSGKALIEGFLRGIESMGNAVYNAVKSQLDRVRNLWPFSPAKEGPFSGKGWTLYSGQSIMEGFAAGIEDKSGNVQDAVAKAMGAAHSQFAATGTADLGASGAPGYGGQSPDGGMPPISVNFEAGAITVDADGNVKLDPKKVAIAANEGNRQLRAFAGAGAK